MKSYRVLWVIALALALQFTANSQISPVSTLSADEATTRALIEETNRQGDVYRVALETFFMDTNCYPAYTTDTTQMIGFAGAPSGTPSFKNFEIKQLPLKTIHGQAPAFGLTTPISYMIRLVPDPFAQVKTSPFAYFGDCHGYLLWSPGPDGKFDIDWAAFDTKANPTDEFKAKYTYDPTNGLLSTGDIWKGEGGKRVKQLQFMN